MQRLTRLLFVACAASVMAGAASAVDDANGAVVGISVRVRGPMSFPTYDADTVYFVKRCEPGETCDERLHASSHATHGRAYWVDAEPGAYVAVAASFQVLGAPDLYFVYFPSEVIEASLVQAVPGGIAFAGSYVLSTSIGLCADTAEPVQLKYAEQIDLGSPKCGLVKSTLGKLAEGKYVIVGGKALPVGGYLYHYRGLAHTARRGADDEAKFLSQAPRDLADGAIQARH